MNEKQFITIPATEMQYRLSSILRKYGFEENRAKQCAEVFTSNSVDGVYTHGVNRFAKFIHHVTDGYIKTHEETSLVSAFDGIEQWNGNLRPCHLNAIHATNNSMNLAKQHGIGC